MQKKYLIALLLPLICLSGCMPESKKTSTQTEPSKIFSQFTGEEVTQNVLNSTSFMAIIENSKDARPQSGLSEADIVFETMAEGGISRFIALFNKNTPKEIGPIRSARPYFLDLAIEYNVPIAHCGASEEAMNRIEKENLMSLNEISNSKPYWRDKSKVAPHNLYTSSDKIIEIMKGKNYTDKSPIKPTFNKDYWIDTDLPSCINLNLNLNKYYSTNYIYKDGMYYKYMDGIPSIDNANKKAITVKNIVIQFTNINLQKDGQHLDIKLVGEGNGYLISNGKYSKIKWYKKDIISPTILKTENDLNIPLSPGNTWWHIVNLNTIVEII